MCINLIDMGACVEYPEKFTTPYMELVYGAVVGDRDLVYQKSLGIKNYFSQKESLPPQKHSSYIPSQYPLTSE